MKDESGVIHITIFRIKRGRSADAHNSLSFMLKTKARSELGGMNAR